MNLSYKVGDDKESVTKNRNEVATYFQLNPEKLVFPDQCHTNHVKIVDSNSVLSDFENTDALITQLKNTGIGVLAADCVPVAFYNPKRKIIAVAHAGWKGTVSRIVQNVVIEMSHTFSCQSKDIHIGIGPAISQKNYEVGEDVVTEIMKLGADKKDFLKYNHDHTKANPDLQEINRRLLIEAGILPENIEIMKLCTHENAGIFFSARRDGFHCGRFGLVICMYSA
jgi:YfiH family protein